MDTSVCMGPNPTAVRKSFQLVEEKPQPTNSLSVEVEFKLDVHNLKRKLEKELGL